MLFRSGQRKCARWRRIAQEAAKQCGRATIPTVDVPCRFEDVLPRLDQAPLILIPTLAVDTQPLSEVLHAHRGANAVVALIGPEGDFSRREVEAAVARGAQPVSLGRLTLRSETAAVATLAVLRYASGGLA